ncbi:MAG: hypothetical protein DRN81_02695 [Thermoproteota archaeon]|nr:MAG: hypothetical protein DRN81_02695 [Candidatus Korarchaeota archaeon]
MGSYQAGTTVTFEARFYNERTGSMVNPDVGSLSLKIYYNGSLFADCTSDIYQVDTGVYACDYSIPETADKGLYVYEWQATINGKPYRESGLFRVRKRKVG